MSRTEIRGYEKVIVWVALGAGVAHCSSLKGIRFVLCKFHGPQLVFSVSKSLGTYGTVTEELLNQRPFRSLCYKAVTEQKL